MDDRKLKKLIKILKESDVSEITIEEDGIRMTVRQGPLTIIESENEAVAVTESNKQAPGKISIDKAIPSGSQKQITSPMVGTFFAAVSPGQDPLVQEGDVVEQEQMLCIIEAMKIMNEITADEPGRIVKVLVEDGSAVEFGQPLFLYEPE